VQASSTPLNGEISFQSFLEKNANKEEDAIIDRDLLSLKTSLSHQDQLLPQRLNLKLLLILQ